MVDQRSNIGVEGDQRDIHLLPSLADPQYLSPEPSSRDSRLARGWQLNESRRGYTHGCITGHDSGPVLHILVAFGADPVAN